VADRGRVVVVAAGFALWSGGRCAAAARWSDVRRLRVHRQAASGDALLLRVELTDGSVVELHEQAPGFDAFLERATIALSGLRPVGDWRHAMEAAPDELGLVVFERKRGW
jgi:hypothetical protein